MQTKIFVSFVDLQKAFDSLWRIGSLYKLYKIAIGKNMFNIIKSQIGKHSRCIQVSKPSYKFNIDKGERQENSISLPCLIFS